ncbi:MAG: hypothetical protein AAFR21_05070 [Pseudomonadota bacterium]
MRTFLLWIGWLSLVGSLFDGFIAGLLCILVITDQAPTTLSVDTHLREHLPFLYWIRAVAEFLFPEPFVVWLFGLPAMIYFPARVIVSVVLGKWALDTAARMKGPS